MEDLMKDYQKLDQQSPEHKCFKENSYDSCEKLLLKFNKPIYFNKMREIISKTHNISIIKRYIKIVKRTRGVTVYKNYTELNKAKKRLQIVYQHKGKKDKNAIYFKKSYLLKPNIEDIKNFIKYADMHILEKSKNFALRSKEKKIFQKLKIKKLLRLYRSKNSSKYYLKAYKLSNNVNDIKNALSLAKTKELKMIANLSAPDKYTHEAKVKLANGYRKKDSYEYYLRAYKLLYQDKDMKNVIRVANEKQLKNLMNMKLNDNYLKKIKSKYLSIVRSKHSFDGFFEAYKLFKNVDDLKYALKLAKTAEQKAKIEKIVFKNIKNKSTLVDVRLVSQDSYTGYDKNSGGMFTKYSLLGKLHIKSKIGVIWNKSSPFQPVYGTYKVLVKLLVVAPRYMQRRSNWVGNADTNDDISVERTLSVKLNAEKMQDIRNYDLGSVVTTFFERGSAGGFTAKWLRDNAYVKVKAVEITFDSVNIVKNKPLNPNIDKVFAYDKPFHKDALALNGSLAESRKLIDHFGSIDRSREGGSSSSSNGSVKVCIPNIPQPSEYSKCRATSASASYENATVVLSRGGGGISSSDCYDIKVYTGNTTGVGNTCGGVNGNWSVRVNGQSGFTNGLGSGIEWLLNRM